MKFKMFTALMMISLLACQSSFAASPMEAKVRHQLLHQEASSEVKSFDQVNGAKDMTSSRCSSLPAKFKDFEEFWQDFKIIVHKNNAEEIAKHIDFPLQGGAYVFYDCDSGPLPRSVFVNDPQKLFTEDCRFLMWNTHGSSMNVHGDAISFIVVWPTFEETGQWFESGVVFRFEKKDGSYKLVHVGLAG